MIPGLDTVGFGVNAPWMSGAGAPGDELLFTQLFDDMGIDHDIHLATSDGTSWTFVAIPISTLNSSDLEDDPFFDRQTQTLWISHGPAGEMMNQIYEVPRTGQT